MDVNLKKAIEAIGDGVNSTGDDVQKSTEEFHEKYISKVVPQSGKYGDAAIFAAELVPGVSEYNSIRKGDWKQLAVDVALDAGMIAAGVATAGLGAGAVAGAKAGTDIAVKGTVKAGENVAKEALQDGAVFGMKKLEKEVAVETIEKSTVGGIKETGEEIAKVTDKTEGIQFKKLPVEGAGGNWEGERGNSGWIFDDSYIPKKGNKADLTWKEIKEKYNIEGIPFKDGEPDFTGISKGTVKINGYTDIRDDNYDKADKLFAKLTGKSPADIEEYRRTNNLTWHERSDMGTMDLVPAEVHGNVPHSGGVSEYKRMKGYSENV